jgi:hypothetical protein
MGYVERGIRRVKMKVAKDFGRSEAEDIRRVAAVRKAVGDSVKIYVDANNGYYAKQAIGMARRLADWRRGLVRGTGARRAYYGSRSLCPRAQGMGLPGDTIGHACSSASRCSPPASP